MSNSNSNSTNVPTLEVDDGNSLLNDIDNVANWLKSTNLTLERALQKDKDKRLAEEKDICWFHENTSRNLALYKLKEGECSVYIFYYLRDIITPFIT